jgi:hypothetical protein
MQLSACVEPRELLTLFSAWLAFLLGLRVGRGGGCGAGFGRVVLEFSIRDLVTAFATEKAKVVIHLILAFLLS